MTVNELKEIVKYKEDNNLNIGEVSKHFGIGVNRLRNLLKQNNISFSKKRVKRSQEVINKIKKSNLKTKNSIRLKIDWKCEYDLFIATYNNDNSIGLRKFCKSRGYGHWYLRDYIKENNLHQPKGIPIRTEEWKNKISKSSIGVVKNPNGSNGKLKGKKLPKSQRDNIQAGLVKHHYGISLDEWKSIQGDKQNYYNEVWRITFQQDLEKLDNYDKRGNAGNEGAYQIDHIYPISKGFMNNIPAEKVGDIKNLQMLPWLENRLKGNIV